MDFPTVSRVDSGLPRMRLSILGYPREMDGYLKMIDQPMTPIFAALDNLHTAEVQGANPYEVASAAALIKEYDQYHDNSIHEVVSVEQTLTTTIPGTRFTLTGRFDTMLRNSRGELINLEHKTTGQNLDNRFHPQLTKTSFDRQISLYHLLSYLNGKMVAETQLDVIRKVSLRPKALPRGTDELIFGSRLEIEQEDSYFGHKLSQESLTKYQSGNLKKETPEMYGARVCNAIAEDQPKYFKRKTGITRSVKEMKFALQQLVMVAKEIERAEDDKLFYQNTNSCHAYGSVCPYFQLCSGTDSLDSETWQPRRGAASSGRFNLSHSRIGVFNSCRAKYFYMYVKGIEKKTREDSDALRYGSLVHDALEQYWLTHKEINDVDA
tara:strand:+ start:2143 stop:3282 length:1140 start_codon:yes stop_codon:yes gene_type:complete